MTAGNALTMSNGTAIVLCVESWRIAQHVQENTAANYSVRRISEELKSLGLEVIDIKGKPYDPGLAPEVVDVVLDPSMGPGEKIVAETIAPIVTLNGSVIDAGQIVVRRGVKGD